MLSEKLFDLTSDGYKCGWYRNYIQSDQVDEDTTLIQHAPDTTDCCTSTINIQSPNIDVFVLAIRRYPQFHMDTDFVNGISNRRDAIPLRSITKL